MTKLADHERHIFTSNLRYQTLLDSVQGRSPNVTLLPFFHPELETWIETGPSRDHFTAAATPISFEAWTDDPARFSTAS